jgi:hypothetical protein
MILKKNKDRLLVFLRDFHNDRDGELWDLGYATWDLALMENIVTKKKLDEQFNDEKTYLIQQSELKRRSFQQ